MGELSLPMKEWFPSGTVGFMSDDAPVHPSFEWPKASRQRRVWYVCRVEQMTQTVTRRLVSSRRKQDVTGTLTLQIGFLPPKGQEQTPEALDKVKAVFKAIVEQGGHARSLAGVLGVPAVRSFACMMLAHLLDRGTRDHLPQRHTDSCFRDQWPS